MIGRGVCIWLMVVLAVAGGLCGCRRAPVAPAPASQPVMTVPAVASQDGISVYFSPGGNGTAAIVEQIEQARETILVQAYQFTSAPIAKALLDAHKRGVRVQIILDPTQEGNRGPGQSSYGKRYSSAQFFHNQGITVAIDRKHAIFHNKVMLIDGRTIITGSFNFTKAAQESNAENVVIIQNKPEIYAAYEANFQEHLKHAITYDGRDAREPSDRRRSR